MEASRRTTESHSVSELKVVTVQGATRALAVLALAWAAATDLPAQVPLAEAPAPETASRGQIAVRDRPSDADLQARLDAVLSKIEVFEGVQASVDAGVVTLTGPPMRGRARKQLAELVSRFEGVVFVNDRIEDAVAVESPVAPLLAKLREYGDAALRFLPVLAVALGVIGVFWALARLTGSVDAPWRWIGLTPLMRDLVQRLMGAILVLAGVLLALDLLDATALVGAVVGVAGVAGLAIGFAFRDIVENYIAGILLSVRHPFAIGDHLLLREHEGKVVRLTSREMVLMTLDGNHLGIPNSTVFKSIVCNYTRNPRRRFEFEVGIGVEEDLKAVRRVGTETLRGLKGVMDDPAPYFLVEALGESSVVVRFLGWVDQRNADFLKVRSEAIRMVKGALDAAGIEMPEPVHRVILRRAPERKPEATVPEDEEVDVAVKTDIDMQIREDLAQSDEANLLEPAGGEKAR